MSDLDRLITLFESFPGVGARQAKRFAFHVLTMNDNDVRDLSKIISDIKASVIECDSCHRFFSKQSNATTLCNICSSQNRDHARLLVVERDSDIQAIERSGMYNGLYFVFGGTVPLLSASENHRLRGGALKATVETRLNFGLAEIILGFSINPDGENTARFVESILSPLVSGTEVTVSHLGRGLSTGSELEYADADTIKNALKNRY